VQVGERRSKGGRGMKTGCIHERNYLMLRPKEELVEHCLILEHNIQALKEQFEVQYKNCMQIINNMDVMNKTIESVRNTSGLEEATK
jgi:hypothetical protein